MNAIIATNAALNLTIPFTFATFSLSFVVKQPPTRMDGTAIIITQGLFATNKAKTAHGLVRDSPRYRILAVIDSTSAGQDAGAVLDGTPRGIPIYASIADFLQESPEPAQHCLVGTAGKGGRVPPGMLEVVKEAMRSGMNIVSGLHEFMGDMPELQALAEAQQVTITDIRRPKPKDQLAFWTGNIRQVHALKLAVLGIDCGIGKRTTARLLLHALRAANVSAEMIYTGQTGWMQGNRYGFIFDSTYNDFISGELEAAMLRCYREAQPDVILLEGQSSLRNPSGPGGAEFSAVGSGSACGVAVRTGPHPLQWLRGRRLGIALGVQRSEVDSRLRLRGDCPDTQHAGTKFRGSPPSPTAVAAGAWSPGVAAY